MALPPGYALTNLGGEMGPPTVTVRVTGRSARVRDVTSALLTVGLRVLAIVVTTLGVVMLAILIKGLLDEPAIAAGPPGPMPESGRPARASPPESPSPVRGAGLPAPGKTSTPGTKQLDSGGGAPTRAGCRAQRTTAALPTPKSPAQSGAGPEASTPVRSSEGDPCPSGPAAGRAVHETNEGGRSPTETPEESTAAPASGPANGSGAGPGPLSGVPAPTSPLPASEPLALASSYGTEPAGDDLKGKDFAATARSPHPIRTSAANTERSGANRSIPWGGATSRPNSIPDEASASQTADAPSPRSKQGPSIQPPIPLARARPLGQGAAIASQPGAQSFFPWWSGAPSAMPAHHTTVATMPGPALQPAPVSLTRAAAALLTGGARPHQSVSPVPRPRVSGEVVRARGSPRSEVVPEGGQDPSSGASGVPPPEHRPEGQPADRGQPVGSHSPDPGPGPGPVGPVPLVLLLLAQAATLLFSLQHWHPALIPALIERPG